MLTPEQKKKETEKAKKYPIYSAKDLNSISSDPKNAQRIAAEKHNKKNRALREVKKGGTVSKAYKKKREQPKGY